MVETGHRQLIVMRHAKTQQVASTDSARELTSRGRGDARAAGSWLRKQGIEPDLVLTSSATRARDTTDLVVDELDVPPEVRVVDELYQASPEEALEIVAGVDGAEHRVLLVGHNPTMEELANLLARQPGDLDEAHLPTAGLVVLALTRPWDQLSAGSAEVVSRHVARA